MLTFPIYGRLSSIDNIVVVFLTYPKGTLTIVWRTPESYDKIIKTIMGIPNGKYVASK
jgi:hypothetical protein